MNSSATYTIRDLENISGIKAHTIRIWEKRYNVLDPDRTDTNIRLYSLGNLRKLLNITLLHNYGYKISKIATFTDERISSAVREIQTLKTARHHAVNDFKIAMLQFDEPMFLATYADLAARKSFSEIYAEVFIPLLEELGTLWQEGTITPAHEHFVSSLVRRKTMTAVEQLPPPSIPGKTLIFFLPALETHDIGLLYLYYEARSRGFQTVYLGAGVDVENLKTAAASFEEPVFVGYFTSDPLQDQLMEYFDYFRENLLLGNHAELWVGGVQVMDLPDGAAGDRIEFLRSAAEYIKKL